MKILSDEVELIDLSKAFAPAGQRLLNFDATKPSNDILKVLMTHKFTLEEMELVFTLVRYRLTGKLIFTNDYIEQQSFNEKAASEETAKNYKEFMKLNEPITVYSQKNVSISIDNDSMGFNIEGALEILIHPAKI